MCRWRGRLQWLSAGNNVVWDWSAEGNVLAKEWMEPLANLSGYQKPSLLGSFRPVDSITRQKWQLSNGSQPAASGETGMHHSTAELFHLQSQSTLAEGPSASSEYRVCHIPVEEICLLKLAGQPTEQDRDGAEVSNNSKCSTTPPYKPFSWVYLLLPSDDWALQTCLPPFSATLRLHIQSERAGTAQLGVSSGSVASAQAELITWWPAPGCGICVTADGHLMTSREQSQSLLSVIPLSSCRSLQETQFSSEDYVLAPGW